MLKTPLCILKRDTVPCGVMGEAESDDIDQTRIIKASLLLIWHYM